MSKEKDIEKKPKLRIFILFLTILALITSGFAIYEILLLESIEDLIRYIVVGWLGLIDFILLLKTRSVWKNKKKKKSKRIGYIIFLFLYTIICGLVGGIIFYVYGQLNGINKEYVTYSSSLVTLTSNECEKISDVKNQNIAILNDKKSPEGYIIPKEIIKENKLEDENQIKSYDDYSTMLADLYAGEVDSIFTSSSYVSMFSNVTGYEEIEKDTKVIISKEKKMKKASTSTTETESSGKSIKEPFTILLMGIDSTDEVLGKNAIANGDTLILVTFNPKTLNATMLSIPRDSYVPIACWPDKAENKITHAAGYGTDCMMNTIEEYFDVNIDYYAKINFKGLVKLVDAVGGVDVEVEKTLCTDDSSREQEICINPGWQTLNGEQALVYARNRKSLANGDFGRAAHQQEIVKALINKVKTVTSISKFMEILNTISNSLDTNLTTKQILSFYNIGKDIVKKSLAADDADLVNIQQLYLQGTGQMIYDEKMRMVLWDYVPNKNSRKDIIQAMKENLELEKHSIIKEFSFSVNEPYEKEIIGEGPYKTGSSYGLLPSFIGYSESVARSIASRAGVSVSFKGNGTVVVDQSFPANKRIDKIRGAVVLTLGGASKEKEETKKETPSTSDKKTQNEESKKEEPTTPPNKEEDNIQNNPPEEPPKEEEPDLNSGEKVE